MCTAHTMIILEHITLPLPPWNPSFIPSNPIHGNSHNALDRCFVNKFHSLFTLENISKEIYCIFIQRVLAQPPPPSNCMVNQKSQNLRDEFKTSKRAIKLCWTYDYIHNSGSITL